MIVAVVGVVAVFGVHPLLTLAGHEPIGAVGVATCQLGGDAGYVSRLRERDSVCSGDISQAVCALERA
ncbi:hypothetical protein [Streptomyces sp. AcE210]|uniref:hypothetical protein n=1 Tax=Streptomyces sp. AcE210 TaxID=2292703 RepID=UPI001404F34B|nr:hypothetical protein [Streptomyces sp. AcE210]